MRVVLRDESKPVTGLRAAITAALAATLLGVGADGASACQEVRLELHAGSAGPGAAVPFDVSGTEEGERYALTIEGDEVASGVDAGGEPGVSGSFAMPDLGGPKRTVTVRAQVAGAGGEECSDEAQMDYLPAEATRGPAQQGPAAAAPQAPLTQGYPPVATPVLPALRDVPLGGVRGSRSPRRTDRPHGGNRVQTPKRRVERRAATKRKRAARKRHRRRHERSRRKDTASTAQRQPPRSWHAPGERLLGDPKVELPFRIAWPLLVAVPLLGLLILGGIRLRELARKRGLGVG